MNRGGFLKNIGLLGAGMSVSGLLQKLSMRPAYTNRVQYNQPTAEHPCTKSKLVKGLAGTRGQLLFWQQDPQRSDPEWQTQTRRRMQAYQARGKRPIVSDFRWKQAFYRSKPGAGRKWSNNPAQEAWYKWLDARRNLMMRNADGSMTSIPVSGGKQAVYGYINPNMPMPRADWPAGRTAGLFTNAEWEARRIAAFAEASGVRGLGLADGSDSMPFGDTRKRDFNPSIIDDFEVRARVKVPGQTIPERARYIKDNLFGQWQDYWNEVYAQYYGTISKAIEKRTGDRAFFFTQAPHTTPPNMRYRSYDSRKIMEHLEGDQFMQTVQVWLFGDRAWSTGRVPLLGSYHARQPDLMRGAMMPTVCGMPITYSSNPGCNQARFFWHRTVGTEGAVDKSKHSSAELSELGKKRMREMWTYLGWTHLANEDGGVERAIEYVTGGGHGGARAGQNLPQPLWEQFQNIHPVSPYGPAAYYSVPVERTFEKHLREYPFSEAIRKFAEEHVVPLYYVSDLTLNQLEPESYPTGWIVPDAARLPAAERRKLKAIAPIYDPENSSKGNITTPLRFAGDATGSAFVDQSGRVVMMATRLSYDKQMAKITIHFKGLPKDGTFNAQGILNPKKQYKIKISNGEGKMTFPLERWQTRVFVTNLPRIS